MVLSDMELHFIHLFPNLLNMYGDVGNLKILADRARRRGINVNMHSINTGDALTFQNADLVMLGDGQASEIKVVVSQLTPHIELLKNYLDNNGVFLAIGGGYQLFGNQYVSLNEESVDGLDILPIHTEKTSDRFVGDIAFEFEEKIVVGFENHKGKITIDSSSAFGRVLRGHGNNGEDGFEGFRYKNFFGTNLHGPLLAQNPDLADFLLLKALQYKYDILQLEPPLNNMYETAARTVSFKKLQI